MKLNFEQILNSPFTYLATTSVNGETRIPHLSVEMDHQRTLLSPENEIFPANALYFLFFFSRKYVNNIFLTILYRY
jgi:hypothetical protein